MENRKYQRNDNANCTVKVSDTGSAWMEAELVDISSGGIGVRLGEEFDLGQRLFVFINIFSSFTDLSLHCKGVLVRKEQIGKKFVYGVELLGVGQDIKIRIDEIFKHKQTGFGSLMLD